MSTQDEYQKYGDFITSKLDASGMYVAATVAVEMYYSHATHREGEGVYSPEYGSAQIGIALLGSDEAFEQAVGLFDASRMDNRFHWLRDRRPGFMVWLCVDEDTSVVGQVVQRTTDGLNNQWFVGSVGGAMFVQGDSRQRVQQDVVKEILRQERNKADATQEEG